MASELWVASREDAASKMPSAATAAVLEIWSGCGRPRRQIRPPRRAAQSKVGAMSDGFLQLAASKLATHPAEAGGPGLLHA
jgi:hypothetical protein